MITPLGSRGTAYSPSAAWSRQDGDAIAALVKPRTISGRKEQGEESIRMRGSESVEGEGGKRRVALRTKRRFCLIM